MPDIPDFFHNGYTDKLFEKHLLPLAGQVGLRFIQIGAYSGDASVWMLDNVLTDSSSLLCDVDTWKGGPDFVDSGVDFTAVEAAYDEKMGVASAYLGGTDERLHRVNKRKQTASEFFSVCISYATDFDFIYIDGGHAAAEVICNAVDAWRCLKVGGILAFDDYNWRNESDDGPGPAIDAFWELFDNCLVPLEQGDQIWFKRTA